MLFRSSAFGGLGIYQNWVFQNLDYSPSANEFTGASEHIYLHQKISEAGSDLYIHPYLLNFGWNPHNLSSFKTFRALDRLSKGTWFRGARRALQNVIR